MKLIVTESQYTEILKEGLTMVTLGSVADKDVKPDNDATKNDSVNKALVDDIRTAAKKAGVAATITTAKSGHKKMVKSGKSVSRHMNGTGVDVAIVGNKGFGESGFKSAGDKLKDALVSMGYKWNTESGNPKAVLWQTNTGGNHFNHLHISNNSSSTSQPSGGGPSTTTSGSTSTQSGQGGNVSEVLSVGDYGKLEISDNKNAPLLVVFGGINVGGQPSGIYMWDYMNKLKGKYHIFVAKNSSINGEQAYDAIKKELSEKQLTPSTKILYLFSGGYGPGMTVLSSNNGDFSSVYLVDIWMGNSRVANFYKQYIDTNGGKTKYYYTSFGANNPKTRDYLASKSSVKQMGNKGHMATNLDAVSTL